MQTIPKTFLSPSGTWPLLDELDTSLPENMGTKPTDLTIILSSSISPYADGEERVTLKMYEGRVALPAILFVIRGEKAGLSLGMLHPRARNILQAILSKK